MAEPLKSQNKAWERPAQKKTVSPVEKKTADSEKKKLSIPGDFYNPYNFIPAIPRNVNHPQLGDKTPVGHDRYYNDYWSGRIAVTLTTITPLLIPDAAKAKQVGNIEEHYAYPLRLVDGKPYLPPTSIKGMLRAAYEAITNSRLSIFHHPDLLAYRMDADNVNSRPARVEMRNGKLGFTVMKALAKLPRYKVYKECETFPPDKGEKLTALKYPHNNLPAHGNLIPQHGDSVWVKFDNQKRVTEIEPRKKVITEKIGERVGFV